VAGLVVEVDLVEVDLVVEVWGGKGILVQISETFKQRSYMVVA
jgi:hypothetical protein